MSRKIASKEGYYHYYSFLYLRLIGINQSINKRSINLLQPNLWRNSYVGAPSGRSNSDPNAKLAHKIVNTKENGVLP
jgi:hypothetical protein